MLGDRDTKGVGDVAQAGEAGRAVVVGFVALDLLLGHSKGFSELALGPPASNTSLDEHRRKFFQRCSIERRQSTRAQEIAVSQFDAQVVCLGAYGVELEPFQFGALARAGL